MDKILDEMYKDVPETISDAIEMKKANLPITIYTGIFSLIHKDFKIEINGKIIYEWLPDAGVKFKGEAKLDLRAFHSAFQNNETFQLKFKDLSFELCILSGFSSTFGTDPTSITGVINHPAIVGDKSILVSRIVFSIPNLRDLHGNDVKKTTPKMLSIGRNRIVLENRVYKLTIDKCRGYDELQNSLNSKGGFIIQYVGELRKNKGDISFEESKSVMHCLDIFLSFLNGRRTSVHFCKGFFDKKVIWTDYSQHLVENYKWVISWPIRRSIEGINEMWKVFSSIWNDKEGKNFLILAVQWYVQANSSSLSIEGQIIMAQTGIELIYNYLLIEKNNLLIGSDAETIGAANKIRLLLSHLNLKTSIPKAFTHLKDISEIDAPEVFVQIRNAIVHSKEKNRKKLLKVNIQAKSEALQLGIWYIELSLLKILEFKGKYYNRTIRDQYPTKCEQVVPWIK